MTLAALSHASLFLTSSCDPVLVTHALVNPHASACDFPLPMTLAAALMTPLLAIL